jgi:hypothetical protein
LPETDTGKKGKMRFSRAAIFTGTSLVFLLQLAGTALAHGHGHGHMPPTMNVPEIDPSLIGSGLALLVGSFLLLIERYRRR